MLNLPEWSATTGPTTGPPISPWCATMVTLPLGQTLVVPSSVGPPADWRSRGRPTRGRQTGTAVWTCHRLRGWQGPARQRQANPAGQRIGSRRLHEAADRCKGDAASDAPIHACLGPTPPNKDHAGCARPPVRTAPFCAGLTIEIGGRPEEPAPRGSFAPVADRRRAAIAVHVSRLTDHRRGCARPGRRG